MRQNIPMNGELISFVFLLLLILDPLGNMPVVSLLRNVPRLSVHALSCAVLSPSVTMIDLLIQGSPAALMRLSDPALANLGGGLIQL